MIIVTGALGFIGSNLVKALNEAGESNLILVDKWSHHKAYTVKNAYFTAFVDRDRFINNIDKQLEGVKMVYHLGARTDTTEFDKGLLERLNFNYSKQVWKACSRASIPLVYASSAATYGDGSKGYDDDESLLVQLKPLNPYGESKHSFDLWVKQQSSNPPKWQGLKFFNVFGPNESHKGRMASVVYHAFNQINECGEVKLFKSHKHDYADGMQLRDFIYVKDVIHVLLALKDKPVRSGIYNLGTGNARTFLDLVKAVFSALEIKDQISFIDMPLDIRDKYQYYTEAEMEKLQRELAIEFLCLEDAVKDYVKWLILNG